MIVDAHLHCSGSETSAEVLGALDDAGVENAVLLAPFLNDPYTLLDADSLRKANEYLARLVRPHRDRLIGFAVVNPLHENAANDLEVAISKLGLRGLKLVPSGWYPYSDCAHRVYERASQLGIPILFHSGIFIDGRSGRFCRPVFYEAVRDYPRLRVALAHLGWPWVDEAIAVGLIDLINGVEPAACQIRFDISFGPPPVYRKEALRRALGTLAPEILHFGSDRFLPCTGSHIKSMIKEVKSLLQELGTTSHDQELIMGANAASWLGLSRAAAAF